MLLQINSCGDDNELIMTNNSLIIIKVDYFNDSIPLSKSYFPLGDFGSVELNYNNSISVFNGTIVSMGLGQILYTENFENAINLEQMSTNIEFPNDLNHIELNQHNTEYEYEIDSNWESINSYEIIENYIQNSLNIATLFYTPGVGEGDPTFWDYILIMNK